MLKRLTGVWLGVLVLGSMIDLAWGGKIIWRSLPKSHLTSDGQPLDAEMVFELGVFKDGFVPSASNTAEWAEHWQGAAITPFVEDPGWFSDTFVVTANVSPFVVGARGYIWGRLTSGGPAEWILLTARDWRWPSDDPLAFSVTWSTTSADEAIVGIVRDPSEEIYLQTGRMETSAVPQLTPEMWRELHFDEGEAADPSVSGWEADPDGDGLSNHLEYAISSNPKSPNESGPWDISCEGDAPVVTLPRNPNRVGTLVAEFSENLRTWSTNLPGSWTLLTDANLGQIFCWDGSSGQAFLRIRAVW